MSAGIFRNRGLENPTLAELLAQTKAEEEKLRDPEYASVKALQKISMMIELVSTESRPRVQEALLTVLGDTEEVPWREFMQHVEKLIPNDREWLAKQLNQNISPE